MLSYRGIKRAALGAVVVACFTAAPTAWGDEAAPSTAAQQPPNGDKQPPTAEEVAGWIAELDDDEYLVRERASRQLLESGTSGLDALLATANGDRLEPADRAVWVLRRLGRSADNDLSIEALKRLIQLRERPQLVQRAESELATRIVVSCQQRLAPLGAEVSVRDEQLVLHGNTVTFAPIVHARLTEKWRGTADDLRCLAELREQRFFRLEGAAVDDAAAAHFEAKEKLTFLQLLDSKVSVAAVDALKKHHPEAVIYMRNQALMGVSAENHAAGVQVLHVQPGSGAHAAGIVQGDIITSLEGQPLPDFDRLTARIAQRQPGEKVDVELLRGQEKSKLQVTLGSWAAQQ